MFFLIDWFQEASASELIQRQLKVKSHRNDGTQGTLTLAAATLGENVASPQPNSVALNWNKETLYVCFQGKDLAI